jgi:hypothetical protein
MPLDESQKLKYEFAEDEVNFLLDALNTKNISGIKPAHILLGIVEKLKNPLNIHELKRKDRRKS